MCPSTAQTFEDYIWHLNSWNVYGNREHPPGDLARAVEPSLLGETVMDEAPPKYPRVWDRWDRGGRSGSVRQMRPPNTPVGSGSQSPLNVAA